MLRDPIIHHSRNEGNRSGKAGMLDGMRGKRMGVLAGYPDIVIHFGGQTFFVEVKREGQYLTETQKALREKLEAQGFKYFVCRSINDAMDVARAIKAACAIKVALPRRWY